MPLSNVFACTDSTIVLHPLTESPRRFKNYVGNRISSIIDRIPPNRWNHVVGTEIPADCASRVMFLLKLFEHELWWKGPFWLTLTPAHWPDQQRDSAIELVSEKEREICIGTTTEFNYPTVPIDRYSSFVCLQCVTAWSLQFIKNCCSARGTRLKSATAAEYPPPPRGDWATKVLKYWGRHN